MEKQAEQEERTFTQEDVNRIVQERIARVRTGVSDLEEREAALVAKENRISCREYLAQNGYDSELLDILDTSDPESFRTKADKISQKMGTAGGTGSTGNFRREHKLPAKSEEDQIREAMGL